MNIWISTERIDPSNTNESFNSKFQDEWLAMEWFRNPLEGMVIIQDCGVTTMKFSRIRV